ncbi:MAG: hypothetical protein ACI4F7_10560 [Acutalibacteraceae bacterium]
MSEKKTYELSRHFSKLENLQNEKTLTYSVLDKGGDSVISLKGSTPDRIYTESCFLPGIGFAYAKSIAVLLCENSFDISTWKEALDDIGVKYILTESRAS